MTAYPVVTATRETCAVCGGSGRAPFGVTIDRKAGTVSPTRCPRCKGEGTAWVVHPEQEAVAKAEHDKAMTELRAALIPSPEPEKEAT